MSQQRNPIAFAALAAMTAALLALGCVSGARSDMLEARARYEQCAKATS